MICAPVGRARAQQVLVDSLLQVLKQAKDDTAKVNTLFLLSESAPEEDILKYAEQALALSEKLHFKKGIANAAGNVGFGYYNQGQIERALEYFIKSLKLQEELGNVEGAAFLLNNIGYILKNQGQTQQALDYYLRALKLLEKTDRQEQLAYFLDNIGEIYVLQGATDKAIECYQRSLRIREGLGSQVGIASSLSYFGVLYNKLGQPDKALDYFQKALKIRQEIPDKHGIANSANNIGAIYLQEKNYPEAEKYLKVSLQAAQEIGYPENIRNASEHLSDIYKIQGKYKEALAMHELFKQMADSILNTETKEAAVKKQMQYEFEKKQASDKLEQEKKEAIQEEEIKQQRMLYWSAGGAVVLIFLLAFLLFNRRHLKQKNKLQQQLNLQQKEQASAVMETQEQERKRIAEDLHDSLGHLLSTAKLNLQTQPVAEKQIEGSLNLLNQAAEEIRNITFNLMPRTLEEGGLIPALHELANKVSNSGSVKIFLHVHDMEKFVLEKQSQFNIYRIVQEAVNNILKHADATEINIQVIGQSNHITIMIEDDGKGFNPDSNKSGRGLKNIVTRSLWLKGHINIDSTPGRGTTITTEFPV